MSASITPYPAKVRHHETVWALDMSKPSLIAEFSAPGIEHLAAGASPYGCACLHSVASGVTQYARYTSPDVLRPLETIRGRLVYVRYTAKANAFTGTLRCNMSYTSDEAGPNTASGRYDAATTGTYDWTEFIQSIEIPSDAVVTLLYLGTTSGSGEVWIRDLRITAIHSSGYSEPDIDPSWEPVEQNIRGFNIGNMFEYTPTDYDRLQSRYKCNLLRVMIQPSYGYTYDLTTEQGYNDMFAFCMADLQTHIALASAHGMKLLVDCHFPPGGRAAPGVAFPTEYSSAWYTQFIEKWKYLAALLKDVPCIYGFDIVNEPAYLWQTGYKQGPLDMNWRQMIHDAIREIRKIDPNRLCVVEHDGFASARLYPFQEPFPFENIVYSFHFYNPNPYNTVANGDGHLVYPGCVGDTVGSVANKEYLRTLLQPARDFQLRYKIPILVGEFAVMRYAGGAATYLRELVQLFTEYRWMWTYFIYSDWPAANVEMLPQLDPSVRVDTILDRGQVLIDAMAGNHVWTDL